MNSNVRNPIKLTTRRGALLVASMVGVLSLKLFSSPAAAASFQEQSGTVVIEAENFDTNFTQPGGAWVYSSTPLTNAAFGGPGAAYAGSGYLKAVGVGGASASMSPHADYKVNFTSTGTHYIWVSGSDAGSANVHVGIDGVVPSTAQFIGSYFGYPLAGELLWDNYYNPGGGGATYPARLEVPSTGEHTINLFFRLQNVYVDKLLLTTDINLLDPLSPPQGGANGYNPDETLAPSASLAVAITQPAPGKSFPSNSVVTVSAKPFTNNTAVSKIEFFAQLLPSGNTNKIGEATNLVYQTGWTNLTVGNYALRAVVTAGGTSATSAVVNVAITVPNTCPTPLVWQTNTFNAGLEDFTAVLANHTTSDIPGFGINFDWSNTSFAGGPAGELGGTFARIGNVTAYVAEPFSRPVSLNDELWFRSSLRLADVTLWNTDFFFGYFDTNSPDSRVGFKILNPNNGIWRYRHFAITQSSARYNLTPDQAVGKFEFHWIPSGLGDGSGTSIATVVSNGVTYVTTNSYPAASTATFNAIGWLIPYQPTSDSQAASAWFDNIEHKVPGYTSLNAQRLGANQIVLSWGADGYSLQYNDSSIGDPNGWVNSPDPVVTVGRTYYTTNTFAPGARFYRLKLNCL